MRRMNSKRQLPKVTFASFTIFIMILLFFSACQPKTKAYVHIEYPGSLFSSVENKLDQIEELTLSGYLDYNDFTVLSMIKNLRKLDISECYVENFPDGAIKCDSIKELILPTHIQKVNDIIGYSSKTSIESIIIPKGVTEISGMAFSNCTNLKKISIPESVNKICLNAFRGCVKLDSIEIPQNVNSIDDSAFQNLCCDITVNKKNKRYYSNNGILYDKYDRKLLACPNSKSGKIIIPSNISQISLYAFQDCDKITEVVIPEGVTTIEMGTFRRCSNLKKVVLPSTILAIKEYAFAGCKNLSSINIPSSIQEIHSSTAFSGCDKLVQKIKDKTPEWYSNDGTILAKAPKGVGGQYDVREGTTIIGVKAFENCSDITNIYLPESIAEIADGAFKGCSGLTEIRIPDGVGIIGFSAFDGCTNLRKISIPQGVIIKGDIENLPIEYR